MGGFFISRSWRTRKTMLALIVLEFPLTVAMLTLFGIANGKPRSTWLAYATPVARGVGFAAVERARVAMGG